MTNWNPLDPIAVGNELLAVDSPEANVTLAAGVGGRFVSTVTESIASARVYCRSQGQANTMPHLVEVYEAGDEPAVDDTLYRDNDYPTASVAKTGTVTRRPSGSTTLADLWISLAGNPGDFYDDYLEFDANSSVDLWMDTGAYATHGRIGAVVVRLWTPDGRTQPTSGSAARRFTVSVISGGVAYGAITWVIPLNTDATPAPGVQGFNWGEINPVTDRPWTQADIQNFSNGTYKVRIARKTGDTGTARLATAQIAPIYEFGERRVAVGKFTSAGPPGDTAAWENVPLRTPLGVANWAKAAGHEYGWTIRQADTGDLRPSTAVDTVFVPGPRVDGAPLPAPQVGLSFAPTVVRTFESDRLFAIIITDVAVLDDRLYPIVFRTAGSATSVDGQPYAEVEPVAMSSTTQQEIISTFGGTYAGLRLVAGTTIVPSTIPSGSAPAVAAAAAAASAPDGPLLVTVRRRSDNLIIAQFTIAASNVPYDSGQMGLVSATTDEFTLAAGVLYYLDFSSVDPRYIVGLAAVEAGGGGVLYQEATYRGGTATADPINGLGAVTLAFTPGDFAAVLDGVLDPPTDVTVTAGTSEAGEPAFQCQVPGIPYIELAWSITDLGVALAYYEIQRLATDLIIWETVAKITTESVSSWRDWDPAVDDVAWYRIRAVRTDGAGSVWVYPTSLLPEILLLEEDGALLLEDDDLPLLLQNAMRMPTPVGCGLFFTSNERPDLNVAYNDVYDSEAVRSYGFPEADEYVTHTLYGRDLQVVFHPTERRGVRFQRRLLLSQVVAPSPRVGPSVADTIRNLAHAPIAYVNVRDSDGNRWQGALIVSTLDVRQPGRFHWVDVEVIETTTTPSTPDAP